MSSDSSNDSGRWLGGIELGDESDAESADADDHIGPITVGTGTFPYTLKHLVRCTFLVMASGGWNGAGPTRRMETLHHELNVHADQSKGLSFQIWPSALNLSRFAEAQHAQRPGIWKGKRVVELGAGCGLVGLVFASLGAHVLLTDLPHVLDITKANVRSNAKAIAAGGGRAEVAELSWGATDVRQMGAWGAPDLVIAADVIYDRALFAPLMQTFNGYGPGTEILLAHVRRWKSDARFFQALQKAGYTLVDTDCGTDSSTGHTPAAEGQLNGQQSDATVLVESSNGVSAGMSQHSSLHTKGALKIFRVCRQA